MKHRGADKELKYQRGNICPEKEHSEVGCSEVQFGYFTFHDLVKLKINQGGHKLA